MSEVKREATDDENDDGILSITDSEVTLDTSDSDIFSNGGNLKELKWKMRAMKYKNQALEAKLESQELREKMRDKSLERLTKKVAQIEATLGMEKIDVKIIMLGASACGKTSLCKQFMNKSFTEAYTASIDGEWHFQTVLHDNRLINIQIWDTAGQERFAPMTSQYFRDVHGLILVYDLCEVKSFGQMVWWWEKFMERQMPAPVGGPNVPMIVVGNKLDLAELGRAVTTSCEKAKQWCAKNGATYFEASAKKATNVDSAFDTIRKMATDYRLNMQRGKEKDGNGTKIVPLDRHGNHTQKKKSGCCS